VSDSAPKAEQYEAYLDALRRRVCSVCLDQRNDGTCGLTQRTCGIEAHLPLLVEALLSVESNRMDEYEAAIKARVCSVCDQQDAAGVCHNRQEARCALWSYLPLVLEAVEEVRGDKG